MSAAAANLGGDVTKIFVVGGSAGGHLTLTTTLSIIAPEQPDAGAVIPRAIFPLCPLVTQIKAVPNLSDDYKAFYNSAEAYADAAMIGKQVVESCGGQYCCSDMQQVSCAECS